MQYLQGDIEIVNIIPTLYSVLSSRNTPKNYKYSENLKINSLLHKKISGDFLSPNLSGEVDKFYVAWVEYRVRRGRVIMISISPV